MITEETYTLNNGVKIPKIALGTWLLDDSQTEKAVKDCGVEREKLFITTKLKAEAKDYIDLMLIHAPEPWSEFRWEDRYFEGNREA